MNQYKALLKEKSNALGVFAKAQRALARVVENIDEEYKRCSDKIAKAQDTIAEENSKAAFLDSEKRRVVTTIENIDKIVGG